MFASTLKGTISNPSRNPKQILNKPERNPKVGRLITIEEIIDRLDPVDFVDSLHVVLAQMSRAVLNNVGEKHWPRVWNQARCRGNAIV